jgi:DNA-directed RNA polymerase specialized sigma24 family protein
MLSLLSELFKIDVEYEDEFGKVHPHILKIAGSVWEKSGKFFSGIIQDQHECFRILMKAAILVSQKYTTGTDTIENPKSYLYTTFRHLVMAEARRQKRHSELEIEEAKKQFEIFSICESEKVCQKILISELRRRMDFWTRDVFDMQIFGYQYKDMVPKYGLSENVIRSKYSKNLLKLKNQIQAEMKNIEKELGGKT